MPKPDAPGRKSVTSDPDRGVAVNSGTDPQRPGTRPVAGSAPAESETPAPEDRFTATHQPMPASRSEDVEHGGKNEPDDPV